MAARRARRTKADRDQPFIPAPSFVPRSSDGRKAPRWWTGAQDFAKVDAHEVGAEEYDEVLEITDAMMARAVPDDGLEMPKRGHGRPKSEAPKRQMTMRLDGDVIAAMRASGPGWQARANEVLRKRFKA